jgi:hypothetical protein
VRVHHDDVHGRDDCAADIPEDTAMTVLVFEDYRQMSDYIKVQGPLPTDQEVRVGSRVILHGRATNVSAGDGRP